MVILGSLWFQQRRTHQIVSKRWKRLIGYQVSKLSHRQHKRLLPNQKASKLRPSRRLLPGLFAPLQNSIRRVCRYARLPNRLLFGEWATRVDVCALMKEESLRQRLDHRCFTDQDHSRPKLRRISHHLFRSWLWRSMSSVGPDVLASKTPKLFQ
jgi:hypothetical protein